MSGTAGRSAGFGRIGAHTRPSMYTPVHSRPPSSLPLPPTPAPVTTRSTAWKAAAIVAALVLAGLAVVLLDTPVAPVPGEQDAGKAGALDAEAERLGRSAFATQRTRG